MSLCFLILYCEVMLRHDNRLRGRHCLWKFWWIAEMFTFSSDLFSFMLLQVKIFWNFYGHSNNHQTFKLDRIPPWLTLYGWSSSDIIFPSLEVTHTLTLLGTGGGGVFWTRIVGSAHFDPFGQNLTLILCDFSWLYP